ncbi:MAG: efflux RND transporter periplasmic adaptor subunit [Acidobacteriota bacterium]|jgi:HlyD family secretion protein
MSTGKKIAIGVGVLVAAGVIIWASTKLTREDLTSVEVGDVTRMKKLVQMVSATGEINPKEYVELQAEISGVITDLYVEEGDSVKKGDVLLRIDPIQTETAMKAQEAILSAAQSEARSQQSQIAVQKTNSERDLASVRVAEAELEKAQQNYELAKGQFERKQALFEDNLISRDDYDTAKNTMLVAKASLKTSEVQKKQAEAQYEVSKVVLDQARSGYESAVSRVKQQQAMLHSQQDLLQKTTIRAPLSGVITQMNVEVGERAVPGTLNNPAATLMIIADLSVIEAELQVDETDIVDLELGQPAVIKVDALPDNPLKGKVTEIGNSAIQTGSSTQEAKDFKVTVQLEDPPASLRPGLSCTGEITTAVREQTLAIPIQALTIREFPADDKGNLVRPEKKSFEMTTEASDKTSKQNGSDEPEKKEFEGVFLVSNGKAVFTPVKTGIVGETQIEILSGLEEGQKIVTGSYKTLRTLSDGDGVKVEPTERG